MIQRTQKYSLLTLTVFFACMQLLCAQVRLPHLISDSMVLQRGAPIHIWGWAAPGEEVSVQFNNKAYKIKTAADGKWTVTLSSMQAGGPYDMQITASNSITLKNILIGDVWICSGQSNMVLPMERVKERYPDEIEQANYPAIRQFFLPTVYNFNKEQDDVPPGRWVAANPQTVLQFSATAYFFAKKIYSKYHVPLGLINTSVGGSPAEAWLSEDALKTFPQYVSLLQQCKDSLYVDSIKKADNAGTNAWNQYINEHDKGLNEQIKWYDTAYNAGTWQTMQVPGYWSDNDVALKDVNGSVWFRKEIDVPARMTGKDVKLMMGRIVDMDVVYVNGVQCGTTGYQYPPRRYTIKAGVLKPGKNIIVVRVINNAGKGGFVLDKPYYLAVAGDTIHLAGNWQYKQGTVAQPLAPTTFFQYKPTGLFNSMIAPLLYCTIKGVLWYQGESNTGKPKEYFSFLPALIHDWRTHWHNNNLPFIYVQLPNYLEEQPQPGESNLAILREAQRKTLSVPNTAMAITIDIGEWNDIHPLNKKGVGERLALAAENLVYGDRAIVATGPLYQAISIRSNKAIITFTNTSGSLIAKGSDTLRYFAIAGADKKFMWAKAVILNNKVIVWSEVVPTPVYVRYAWADNPAGANLYNNEGLPASPFTTEEFKAKQNKVQLRSQISNNQDR